MNGKDALEAIKKDDELKVIPVAMFSTAATASDKKFYLQYGVELVKKPSDYKIIINEIQRLLIPCFSRRD